MIELRIRPPFMPDVSHKSILKDGLKLFLCPFCSEPIKYYYFVDRYCANLECARALPNMKDISEKEEVRIAWHFGG